MERHWKRLHDYAAQVFATQGLDDVVAEEVANPPGMDEIASLMWIKHYAERDLYDTLIVDCAPTGETLQLLMFPDAARWWLDKIYPWERKAMKLARPLLQSMIDVPLPTDDVYASIKDLLIDIEGMKNVLVDSEVTSVRLVLNLEKMVVKEAKRAFTYLSLFGYATDAVIVAWFVTVLPLASRFEAGPEAGWWHRPATAHAIAGAGLFLALAGGTWAAVRTPGALHSVDEVRDATGFEFDAERVAETAPPSAEELALLRSSVAPQLASDYPEFAQRVWG